MSQNNKNWLVLVTKPRNEKKVESRLNKIGIVKPVKVELPFGPAVNTWVIPEYTPVVSPV